MSVLTLCVCLILATLKQKPKMSNKSFPVSFLIRSLTVLIRAETSSITTDMALLKTLMAGLSTTPCACKTIRTPLLKYLMHSITSPTKSAASLMTSLNRFPLDRLMHFICSFECHCEILFGACSSVQCRLCSFLVDRPQHAGKIRHDGCGMPQSPASQNCHFQTVAFQNM